MARSNPEDVALGLAPECHLDLADPVHAVGRHPGKRHVRRDRPLDHRQRQLRLGHEGQLLRHVRGRPAARVVGPSLRQVEGAVEESMPLGRDVSCEHTDLAVGDLARRARILTMNPAGSLTLLEEAGLVEDQHSVRFGQGLDDVLAHDIAQGIRVPLATPKHRLLTPWSGITSGLGSHPASLAPFRPEQAVQEGTGRASDARHGKQRADLILGVTQDRRPELKHDFKRGSRHENLPSLAVR